jgi:hypothetical protein
LDSSITNSLTRPRRTDEAASRIGTIESALQQTYGVGVSFILELVGEIFTPFPDIGKRRRERHRREMWERHQFPMLRRNKRFSTWTTGTGHAEAGRLTFSAPPISAEVRDIHRAVLDGEGPAWRGPTTLLTITTTAGRSEQFVVLSEYALRIVAVLTPPADSSAIGQEA